MRNSINCFVLSLISSWSFGQIRFESDTLRFTADSSYSRAIARFKGNLLFGTSKTGVIAYNENSKSATTLIPATKAGEFRDIVVKQDKFYAITSGDDGLLLSYAAGKTDTHIHEKSAFFDDLAAIKQFICVLGDPINGSFYLKQWNLKNKSVQQISIPSFTEEACYAASGTTAQYLKGGDYVFVSGGASAVRFFRFSWKDTNEVLKVDLPLAKAEGAGPFSVFFWNNLEGVCVGGNYTQPNSTIGTACFTTDGGKTWSASSTFGYRSCVTGSKKLLFACGSTGIDYSTDQGKTWKPFQKGNFCAMLWEKGTLYATSNKGYCVRYRILESDLKW